jgi:ABC-2 type transport system permease protein
MKRKQIKRQNIIQLFISLVIIILINYIVSFLFFRFDLTSEKRYSLTPLTKNTLRNLDDNVYIKIYLEGDDLPAGFKRLQNSVRELLDEYKVYAGKYIDFDFINPSKNPDREMRYKIYDELAQKGMMPIEIKENSTEGKSSQKVIFPGAIIYFKGKELSLNLLKNNQSTSAETNLNNSIQSLEYEFTNALVKLNHKNIIKVAFTKGHGELNDLQIRDMVITLSEYYKVERVQLDTGATDLNRYQTIIFPKPLIPFSENEKYMIDQYVMNGGKILWLVDGVVANTDSLQQNSLTLAMANSLNLEDLFFKYGFRINPDIVEDLRCAAIGLTVAGATGQPNIKLFPWQFYPVIITTGNHTITKYLSPVKTEFLSTIDTVGSSNQIQKKILLYSSSFSKISPVPMRITFDLLNITDESIYHTPPQPVAALIEGVFHSAFKNRPLRKFTTNITGFRDSSVATKMIVVADGDVIRNELSLNRDIVPLGIDPKTKQTFRGNKEFILNAMNYLNDDGGLMGLRTRELKLRLLDKKDIQTSKTTLQIFNTLIPVLFIIIFGVCLSLWKKRKYTTGFFR